MKRGVWITMNNCYFWKRKLFENTQQSPRSLKPNLNPLRYHSHLVETNLLCSVVNDTLRLESKLVSKRILVPLCPDLLQCVVAWWWYITPGMNLRWLYVQHCLSLLSDYHAHIQKPSSHVSRLTFSLSRYQIKHLWWNLMVFACEKCDGALKRGK